MYYASSGKLLPFVKKAFDFSADVKQLGMEEWLLCDKLSVSYLRAQFSNW